MVFEVKTIDRVLGVQARELETPFDRTAVAGFQFEVYQRLQRFNDTTVTGGGITSARSVKERNGQKFWRT